MDQYALRFAYAMGIILVINGTIINNWILQVLGIIFIIGGTFGWD